MNHLITIAAIIASLALVACGADDEEMSAAEAPAAEAAADEQSAETTAEDSPAGGGSSKQGQGGGGKPGTTITTGGSQFGEILFDGSDQAIYLFDKESSKTSECYGDCAEAWPPVLTEGDPQAGGGADAKLLGTTERDDGSTQVTYDGHPLYYYAHEGPGEVLCHNVDEFGGLWLVLEPSGEAVG
ncbi:MAG: COG4315 family predicted lipoprotein [Solirubrobacterales bacterium]